MLSLQFIPAGEATIYLPIVPSAVLTQVKTRLEQVHHLKKKTFKLDNKLRTVTLHEFSLNLRSYCYSVKTASTLHSSKTA